VFFLLGAWAGGSSQGLRGVMRQGGELAVLGFGEVRQWAIATITERPKPQPTAAEPTSADLLRSARSAFDRGEVNQSVALYRERLRRDPADLDARGELGNALTSAGRLAEADEAYYEVALRLARSGKGARASALEAAIRRHDTARADKLAAELRTAKAGD
jgi:Flp pilus assembly protein TadD